MGTGETVNWGGGTSTVIYRGMTGYGRNTIARWTYTGNDTAPALSHGFAAGTTIDMLNGRDLNALALAFNPDFGQYDLTGTVRTTVNAGVYTITWASGNTFVEGAAGMVGRVIYINGVNYSIVS